MKLPIWRIAALGAATLALLVGGVGTALAAPSTNWQLASGAAQATTSGVAALNFTTQEKTRLLYNSKNTELLGDKSGRTMTATFTVAGVTEGTFTYGGAACGGTAPTVRLYFESTPPGAKFAYTNYWWSNPASAVLANGTLTVSAPVSATSQWGDWNGQTTTTNPDVVHAFNDAAKNITAVGLSFGGGCFFENGVGTTDGSGTFTLNSLTFSTS